MRAFLFATLAKREPMNKIVPFPCILNSWALMRQFCEIYALSERVKRQSERLLCGHGTSEEICQSIRLLQAWGERMEQLLIHVYEANEQEILKRSDD
jgi:hypothetical protein